jgi:hypothetical protein
MFPFVCFVSFSVHNHDRWSCYALLWTTTIFAIVSVSVCDFIRFSFDPTDNTTGGGSMDDAEVTFGMFCFSFEALGIERAKSNAVGKAFPSVQAARVFSVLAAQFLPVGLVLLHVAYFVQLPNQTTAKRLWWTIRVLAIASMVSVLCSFSFYRGNANCVESDHCSVGAGAILAGMNAVLLNVLVVALFWSGPPQAPLIRCSEKSCCRKERPSAADPKDNKDTATPVVLCDMLPTVHLTTASATEDDSAAGTGDEETPEETPADACHAKLPAATTTPTSTTTTGEVTEDGIDPRLHWAKIKL